MSLKTWAIISSDKIKLLLIFIPSHWCPSALSHVTQLRTPENICHAFQKCIYSTVTFEEILWWHFVKIQMKQERNFPMTVVLGGVWGRVLLVCFLAPVWPHTRDSHQNNLQKQSNCKETVPRWRGAVIASVPVQVESTKKNRTSWHYSELGKEALQEKQAKNGKILKNLTWKPWYLICWVSDKKCCRLPAVSYQHAISFRSSSCLQLPCSGIGRVTGGHVLFTLRSPQAYSVVTTSCHLCCDIVWRRPTRQVHVQREINERSTQLIYRKCIWCKGPEWRKIWQCPLNEDRSRPWPLFIYLFIFTKGKKKQTNKLLCN